VSGVSWIDVGRSASSSGATDEGVGSSDSPPEAMGCSLPVAASVGLTAEVPAAAESPMAVATAAVMAARSDSFALPPTAIWPTNPPTRNRVVRELVDPFSTS
jgi:hypothetical protein